MKRAIRRSCPAASSSGRRWRARSRHKPSVLLLDEPLSNLDLKLREAMRIELKEIQQQLGMTFLYVTHDQEEAMAMSDRVIVMSEGVVAQEGAPDRYLPAAEHVVRRGFHRQVEHPAGRERRRARASSFASNMGDGQSVAVWRRAVTASAAIRSAIAAYVPKPSSSVSRSSGARGANVLDGIVAKAVNLGAHIDCGCRSARN